MNNRIFCLLPVFACLAVFLCCENPPDNPLVGVWEADVPGGDDIGYGATWRFKKDGSYHLDFYSGSMGGSGEGSESGTYEFISDSIMTIHRTEYDSVGYVINEAWGDTLHVVLKDSRLVTTRVDSHAPFTLGDQSFYWQRSQ